jgi:hypothetical protein
MIPDKLDLASAKPPSVLVKPDPVIVAADPGAMFVAPIPCMLLPPSTPPTAVGNFPRVVVVNPTPHPTPPATPVLTASAPPAPSGGQHLAPPPRLSAAVTRQRTPDATIPSTPAPAPPSGSSPPQLPVQASVAVATQVTARQPQPQHQPQLLRLQQQPEPQPHRPVDDTLKPSDRRFFLQQDQSPSPERDVQDRGSNGSISTGKSPSETGEVQPSSVTSNQTRASAASAASSHPTGRGRRTRNAPVRPAMTRLNSGRVAQVTRKDPMKARTAAPHAKAADKAAATKVSGSSRQQRSPIEPLPPPSKVQAPQMNGTTTAVAPKGVTSSPEATRAGAGAPRRGIVVSNSSSEFETTDTDDDDDDDSWASEDISEGAAETRPTDKRPPTKEEIKLREAVVEAQRQRELFVKQPKRSYSNLGRTQSGLLSQLLNPDPTVLPPARPYRISSSHEMTRPGIPSALTSGKSSAAVPQAAQITAQAPMGAAATSSGNGNSNGKVSGSGGYRPKGRPQGQELEDDSDSPDDPDDTIQVSHSLAQQRLAALANPATRRRASDNQVQPPQAPGMGLTATRPLLQTVATSPIPLNHPWNLPAPAPPTTPRTTRRQMLATELSESLRRNLLWERQVSKTNLLGNGRRNGGGGGTGGGLRTVGVANGNAQPGPSQLQQQLQQQQLQQQQQPRQQQQKQQRQGGSAGAAEGAPAAAVDDNVAERRRRALARNRTWDDFHYFGW